MSDQARLPGFDGAEPQVRFPVEAIRASIGRELRYLLARSRETGGFWSDPRWSFSFYRCVSH